MAAIGSGGCATCGKVSTKLQRCTRCESVRYCSRNCQTKDWPGHKSSCATDVTLDHILSGIEAALWGRARAGTMVDKLKRIERLSGGKSSRDNIHDRLGSYQRCWPLIACVIADLEILFKTSFRAGGSELPLAVLPPAGSATSSPPSGCPQWWSLWSRTARRAAPCTWRHFPASSWASTARMLRPWRPCAP